MCVARPLQMLFWQRLRVQNRSSRATNDSAYCANLGGSNLIARKVGLRASNSVSGLCFSAPLGLV